MKRNKQTGAALALALVFMVLITTLAVTTMYNSSLDAKMSQASSSKASAMFRALGGLNEFIQRARLLQLKDLAVNPLATGLEVDSEELPVSETIAKLMNTGPAQTSTCSFSNNSDDIDSMGNGGVGRGGASKTICQTFRLMATHYYGSRADDSKVLTSRRKSQAVATVMTKVSI